jgi:hypothetical protein
VIEFTYLGKCISSDGSVTKGSFCLRQPETCGAGKMSLAVKGWVCNASIRRILLYGCEIERLRASDAKQLGLFDRRCLRSVVHIGWSDHASNECVRKLVYDSGDYRLLSALLKQQRFRWLGHVLRMPSTRFPHEILFALPEREWRKKAGGQTVICNERWRQQRGIWLEWAHVAFMDGAIEIPLYFGCTLEDVAQNRSHWRECCHFLTS